MSWVVIIALALAVALAAVVLFRVPQRQWALLGMALALGLAGYAWQGRPDMAGAPKSAARDKPVDGAAMVAARQGFADSPPSNYMIMSDAFARRGDFANAAGVLQAALRTNPKDGAAWLAMANALVEQADGQMTPAALYAYRQAADVAPDNAGPAYFLGVAMIRNGRLIEGDQLWREALRKSPADAPWRADLEQRIKALETLMRRIAGQ